MQFSKIPGHSILKKHLIHTVEEQRISSTQLFSGPEGCGSLALAVAFCQYIACNERTSEDSCGKCSSCLKFEKLSHPDLHFSIPVNRNKDGTKDMGSDEFITEWRSFFLNDFFVSRDEWQKELHLDNKQLLITTYEASQIIKKLNYKSYESEYKFLIMWLPEKMNLEASNRLLKTFEEPFEKTLIIMVTEEYDAIIKTILSRSQLIKIPAYNNQELSEAIVERLKVSEEKANKIAVLSNGNFCKAKWLIEQTDDATHTFDNFRQWLRDIVTFNITELLKHMDIFSKLGRENQKGYLAYAQFMLRQVFAHKFNPSVATLSDDERDFAEKFSVFVHIEGLSQISELINEAAYHIERNGNAKMIFFDLSMNLGKFLKKEKVTV